MGSYGNAVMTGFICRLCSEQKKCVIHLYSRKGEEMNLMKKIALLPIKVEKYDHLPKTICESCIGKVNMQYNLLKNITKSIKIQRRHSAHEHSGRCPTSCPLHPLHNHGTHEDDEESGESLTPDEVVDEEEINDSEEEDSGGTTEEVTTD